MLGTIGIAAAFAGCKVKLLGEVQFSWYVVGVLCSRSGAFEHAHHTFTHLSAAREPCRRWSEAATEQHEAAHSLRVACATWITNQG